MPPQYHSLPASLGATFPLAALAAHHANAPCCLVCITRTLWSCPAARSPGQRTRAAASSASSVAPSPPAKRAASAARSDSSARSSQRSAAAKAACVGAGAAGAAGASWAPGVKAAAGRRQSSCRLRGAQQRAVFNRLLQAALLERPHEMNSVSTARSRKLPEQRGRGCTGARSRRRP
jgi:hypothetical protein